MDQVHHSADRHRSGFFLPRSSRKKPADPTGTGNDSEPQTAVPILRSRPRPNLANNSPAAFLAKKHPPSPIQYQRVTPRFFAVSGYKGDKVWYDRCNFSGRLVHCVLINYSAEEEHAWDDVVTRMSLSLSGK